MITLPLSSLLICLGLILLSVLLVDRAKKTALFGPRLLPVAACASGLLIVVGLVVHFSVPATGPSARRAAGPSETQPKPATFSFDPKTVRWGEEVRLHVAPEPEKIEVYLNGNPLPSKKVQSGLFAVIVPTISKSGYLTLKVSGAKVRATEELVVLPR